MPNERAASAKSSSTLFSVPESCHRVIHPVIEVQPLFGSIPANEQQEFTVHFSPKSAARLVMYLTGQIANLHPSLVQPSIKTVAKSFLPLYYFDLPRQSSYFNTKRRGMRMCGAGDVADEDTKVVEFEVVGFGSNHVK